LLRLGKIYKCKTFYDKAPIGKHSKIFLFEKDKRQTKENDEKEAKRPVADFIKLFYFAIL
jgi:hypothetical protein